MIHVHQFNLQPAVGGGEIYTRWYTRALVEAGASVSLYVDPENRFWDGLDSERVEIIRTRDPGEMISRLPARGAWVVTQSRIPAEVTGLAVEKHVLTGFSHMPIFNRSAAEFAAYSAVFAVSRYCIGLLREAGISQVYPVPLYGTWALERSATATHGGQIRASSPYHWDKRKGRDRVLSVLEPVVRAFATPLEFARKPGLSLGIVSLLSPIKQFPVLFSQVAPHIAKYPGVNLEIFGNGGYAQVRDLKRALSPIADRVRFWGYQEQVQSIYSGIDYLMTGLPEKEALGLNALEAQALGTPVIAPRAPPFTETIVHGEGGFLYVDPRDDGGADFSQLLGSLVAGRKRPDPREASGHLTAFSFPAMVERTTDLLKFMEQRFPRAHGK